MIIPGVSSHSLPKGVLMVFVFMASAALCATAQVETPLITRENGPPRDIPFEIVLNLSPGDGNPRNSEGDFIQLKDGRLLFIYTRFTGGSGDHAEACLTSRCSLDNGATWSHEDDLVISNEGGMNVMSVSLLRLQDDSIALFYLRKNATDDCRPIMRLSHDECESWGPPTECIPEPVGYYVVNNSRVIQLRSGRLIIPAALHALKGQDFSSRGKVICYLSDDSGKTWRPSDTTLEAPLDIKTGFQEPGVVELSDGAIFMLLRNSSGVFYQSRSVDGGTTWSKTEPTTLKTPVSPASFKTLPGSDALLLLWNDHEAALPAIQGKRTPFTLALSLDEGETWTHKVNLENDMHGWYCYTAIAFTDQHVLLGYCAGDTRIMNGLSRTRIARIPLAWIFQHTGR